MDIINYISDTLTSFNTLLSIGLGYLINQVPNLLMNLPKILHK